MYDRSAIECAVMAFSSSLTLGIIPAFMMDTLSHMARHGIRNGENMRGEERERGMTQRESPEEDSPRVSMFHGHRDHVSVGERSCFTILSIESQEWGDHVS